MVGGCGNVNSSIELLLPILKLNLNFCTNKHNSNANVMLFIDNLLNKTTNLYSTSCLLFLLTFSIVMCAFGFLELVICVKKQINK